jgi:hypothetical protein
MLYEAMKAEPDRYAEELSNFLGVDPGPTKALLHDRHEHRSLDRREPWDGNDKAALSMLSAEASPQTGEAGDFVRTSDRPEKDHERIIRDLRDRYRAGNTRLLELVPLPIRRYGYAT